MDNDDITIKRNKSMKFKRKLNNIYYERNKEKKEINGKEIILSYTNFSFNKDVKSENEENSDNEKRKIEKTPLNVFAKFRKNRKSKE